MIVPLNRWKWKYFYSIPPSRIDFIKNIIFITLNIIYIGFVDKLCGEIWMGEKNPVTIFSIINHAYYNTLKVLKYHLSHPLPKHSLVCDVSPKIKQ